MKNIKIVLQTLRDKKLYVKLNKCEFEVMKVNFFGHVITKGGVKVDLSKVEIMVIWERPRSRVKLAGYYRRFIVIFSLIAFPPTRLIRKNISFIWIGEYE